MLPDNFRIAVQNNNRETIDANVIEIKIRGKYFNDQGKLIFDSETADILSQSSSMSANTTIHTSTVDNGNKTNPWVEMDVHISFDFVSHTASLTGAISFILERATADTPVWHDDFEMLGKSMFVNFESSWNEGDFDKVQQDIVVNVK